jgi:hypothetical protein
MIGIYKIINPEGKIYIGLSKNIKKRWLDYKNLTSMSNNSVLKESLKKYGYNNHTFEIKEECTLEELRSREKFWINYYQSNKIGLNGNKGGCGAGSHTPESKQKISEALKNKPKPSNFGAKRKKWQQDEEWKQKIKNAPRCPILMFDLENNFVKEFPNQQAAADHLGVKKNAIWNFLNEYPNPNGKPLTHVRGYKFKYKVKYL